MIVAENKVKGEFQLFVFMNTLQTWPLLKKLRCLGCEAVQCIRSSKTIACSVGQSGSDVFMHDKRFGANLISLTNQMDVYQQQCTMYFALLLKNLRSVFFPLFITCSSRILRSSHAFPFLLDCFMLYGTCPTKPLILELDCNNWLDYYKPHHSGWKLIKCLSHLASLYWKRNTGVS